MHAKRLLADVLNKAHVVEQLFFLAESNPLDAREPLRAALLNLFNDLADVRQEGRAAGLFAQEADGAFLHPDAVEVAAA